MECVEFKVVLPMKERDKYKCERIYVLLIFVKLYTKSSPDYKIQREDSNKKLQKRKALIEQACCAASSPHSGELKGRPA